MTTQNDLEIEGVTKRYGTHVAVASLSLAVARGSFFSILGPSGCGKTTLLRIIAGFLEPDEGDVRIGNASMRNVAPNRRPVNMVFQHLALFPMMNVGENVGYGLARRGVSRNEIGQRVDAMLKRVGLADAAGKRIDQLSGGQKQRVAIARALIARPELVAERARLVIAERERVASALRELGMMVHASGANFILFEQEKRSANDLHAGLFRRGVLIRNVSGTPDLMRALRVSIGAPPANDAFLAALRAEMGA